MTTVNIPEDILERVVRAAHAATPQEAVTLEHNDQHLPLLEQLK